MDDIASTINQTTNVTLPDKATNKSLDWFHQIVEEM